MTLRERVAEALARVDLRTAYEDAAIPDYLPDADCALVVVWDIIAASPHWHEDTWGVPAIYRDSLAAIFGRPSDGAA